MELFYFIPTDGVFVEHKDKKKRKLSEDVRIKRIPNCSKCSYYHSHQRALLVFGGVILLF